MTDQSIELDRFDRELITLLQHNPRTSYPELAQALGVSASTARRRTERLLSSGALKLIAVPIWSKLGLGLVAIIGISVDLRRLREVAAELASMDEISWVAMTAGVYDMVAQIALPQNRDLIPFVAERIAPIQGIRDLQTLMVPEFAKTFDQYKIQLDPDPLYSGAAKTDDEPDKSPDSE